MLHQEVLHHTPLVRHADTYRVERVAQRTSEAVSHLRLINQALSRLDLRPIIRPELAEAPFKLIEIGSGSGATTLAIKEIYPQSKVTAIDHDPRAQEILKDNPAIENFLLLDVRQLSDSQGRELFATADLVVALRTSVQVGAHLLPKLAEWGFKGQFIFSWIRESDEQHYQGEIQMINRAVSDNQITRHTLNEGRAFNEQAHVVDYSQPLRLRQNKPL